MISDRFDQEIQTAAPMGKGRIMVVDDEIKLLILQERTLNSLGYKVTPVNSSIKALLYKPVKRNELAKAMGDVLNGNT